MREAVLTSVKDDRIASTSHPRPDDKVVEGVPVDVPHAGKRLPKPTAEARDKDPVRSINLRAFGATFLQQKKALVPRARSISVNDEEAADAGSQARKAQSNICIAIPVHVANSADRRTQIALEPFRFGKTNAIKAIEGGKVQNTMYIHKSHHPDQNSAWDAVSILSPGDGFVREQ